MILEAANEFNLDLNRSILIGDKASDLEAGHRAGIKTNIIFGPQSKKLSLDFDYYSVSNLEDAIVYI